MADGIQQIQVEGVKNLEEEIGKHKGKKSVFIMFIASMDESGDSWCPDCRDAEPIVETALKEIKAPDDGVFILAVVGDKPTWKDAKNDFRTHEKFQLKAVPTLLEWNTMKRLVEDELKIQKDVNEFFS